MIHILLLISIIFNLLCALLWMWVGKPYHYGWIIAHLLSASMCLWAL